MGTTLVAVVPGQGTRAWSTRRVGITRDLDTRPGVLSQEGSPLGGLVAHGASPTWHARASPVGCHGRVGMSQMMRPVRAFLRLVHRLGWVGRRGLVVEEEARGGWTGCWMEEDSVAIENGRERERGGNGKSRSRRRRPCRETHFGDSRGRRPAAEGFRGRWSRDVWRCGLGNQRDALNECICCRAPEQSDDCAIAAAMAGYFCLLRCRG